MGGSAATTDWGGPLVAGRRARRDQLLDELFLLLQQLLREREVRFGNFLDRRQRGREGRDRRSAAAACSSSRATSGTTPGPRPAWTETGRRRRWPASDNSVSTWTFPLCDWGGLERVRSMQRICGSCQAPSRRQGAGGPNHLSSHVFSGLCHRRGGLQQDGQRGPHPVHVLRDGGARGVRTAGPQGVREALVVVEHLADRGGRSG